MGRSLVPIFLLGGDDQRARAQALFRSRHGMLVAHYAMDAVSPGCLRHSAHCSCSWQRYYWRCSCHWSNASITTTTIATELASVAAVFSPAVLPTVAAPTVTASVPVPSSSA